MAGSKRERELHRAKLARQQKEAAAAADRRRRRLQIGGAAGAVILVIAAVAGIAAATGGSDSPSNEASTPAVSVPPVNTKGVTCKPVNNKKPATTKYTKYEAALIEGGEYSENMDTNCGRISFTMDVKKAPETTKAMAFLSDRGYFDNTKCHRLTAGNGNFVLQCGDPTGTGSGSPGFTVPDENLPTADAGATTVVYPRGTVAMANGGPNTNGSQFFIVYKDSTFGPDYTRLGTVTAGMNIVDYVASKGTVDGSADGAPKQPLQITKMQSAATITQEAPTPIRTTTTPSPK